MSVVVSHSGFDILRLSFSWHGQIAEGIHMCAARWIKRLCWYSKARADFALVDWNMQDTCLILV